MVSCWDVIPIAAQTISNGVIFGVLDDRITLTEFALYVLLVMYGERGKTGISSADLSGDLQVPPDTVNEMLGKLEKADYIKMSAGKIRLLI